MASKIHVTITIVDDKGKTVQTVCDETLGERVFSSGGRGYGVYNLRPTTPEGERLIGQCQFSVVGSKKA